MPILSALPTRLKASCQLLLQLIQLPIALICGSTRRMASLGVILMQLIPFADPKALRLLDGSRRRFTRRWDRRASPAR
jgi:hypothetical protein